MKRKIKSRSKAAKGPGPLARWWTGLDITARHRTILAICQAWMLAAIVGGSLWGVLALRKFVLAQPDFAPAAARATLELADRPDWMTDSLVEDLRVELMGSREAQGWTFDAGLVRRVGQAAATCPWVKVLEKVQIERTAAGPDDSGTAGRIVVRAQYRRPVAKVQDGHEQYIDAQGVLLPAEQVAELGLKGPLPQIVNPGARCPAVGQVWPGQDIQAALAVLSLLADKPYFSEITAVDVDCRRKGWSGGQSPIVLFAGSEQVLTRICFGALPVGDLDRVPGQPRTARKIAYLDGWYKRNAQRLAGPEQLDLTFEGNLMISPRDYAPAS